MCYNSQPASALSDVGRLHGFTESVTIPVGPKCVIRMYVGLKRVHESILMYLNFSQKKNILLLIDQMHIFTIRFNKFLRTFHRYQ